MIKMTSGAKIFKFHHTDFIHSMHPEFYNLSHDFKSLSKIINAKTLYQLSSISFYPNDVILWVDLLNLSEKQQSQFLIQPESASGMMLLKDCEAKSLLLLYNSLKTNKKVEEYIKMQVRRSIKIKKSLRDNLLDEKTKLWVMSIILGG